MRSPSRAWLIVGFLTGCAQPSIRHTSPERVTTRSSSNNYTVTASELARIAQGGDLMTALQHLRPWALAARDSTFLVTVYGLAFGDVSVLRDIRANDVCEVRLKRGISAASGIAVVLPDGGVSSGKDWIEVSMRHGDSTVCSSR